MTNVFSLKISNDARKNGNENYKISNNFYIELNLDGYQLIRTIQRRINVYIGVLN